MVFAIRGGIHPEDKKSATKKKAIELVKAPEYVSLPMSMNIGSECEPVVKVGDIVKIGQKIADSNDELSVPIHATISGEVVSIEDKIAPTGVKNLTITIKNDYQSEYFDNLKNYKYTTMPSNAIIDAIREGGIVGHGGAAFPTHYKMKSALGKIDTIIINGAECEPYITSDYRLMMEKSDEIIAGLKILEKTFNVSNILIGVEQNKKETFPIIEKAISDASSPAKLCKLPKIFPQGEEKQLIYSLTKREVPLKKLPADIGCVVFNVDTVIAINRLFETGMPMIRRIVTVSGSAVANPKNLEAPIGTPVSHLIECAGGLKDEPNKLIMGGPMMGVAQFTTDIPVIKATNAFLAFCKDEDRRQNNPQCIRCGKCVQSCPMGLSPIYMNNYANKGMYDEFLKTGGNDCIDCGCCSYICPARIDLVQNFKIAKEKLMKLKNK